MILLWFLTGVYRSVSTPAIIIVLIVELDAFLIRLATRFARVQDDGPTNLSDSVIFLLNFRYCID